MFYASKERILMSAGLLLSELEMLQKRISPFKAPIARIYSLHNVPHLGFFPISNTTTV
jgi:hypothetical protein